MRQAILHAVTIETLARANGQGKHLIHAREKNKIRQGGIDSAFANSPTPINTASTTKAITLTDIPKISNSDIPPPSFPVLVSMFSTQAAVALGLIPHPMTKQYSTELPLAKHFIGMLTVLDEKSKGNLTAEESTFLERTLHQLRLAFVEAEKKK